MASKQIQLSKKFVIATQDDIERYKIKKVYDEYFDEYNYQIAWFNVAIGYNVPNPQGIIQRLDGLYAGRFGAIISQAMPFCDQHGYRFNTPGATVVPDTFTREMQNPKLTVYLISEHLELLEAFSNILVIKHNVANSANLVMTVELNDSTSIYSMA